MVSRSPSSSDVSSDSSAKANHSLSSRNNPSVNRPTRPFATVSRPRYNRSRSRSPYRAPRGEKRRREDDYTRVRSDRDPRTFNVKYEEERQRSRKDGVSEDRHQKRSRTYSRSRSRSRSPYRKRHETPSASSMSNTSKPIDRTELLKRKGLGSTKGVFSSASREGSKAPEPTTSAIQPLVTTDVGSQSTRSMNYVSAAKTDPEVAGSEAIEPSVIAQAANHPRLSEEAALIEERRKRREAIRNKYRGQATPLLMQALHVNADGSGTPGAESTATSPRRSESPLPSSPGTPRDISGPSSPDVIGIEDLVNHDAASPIADDPSAADYDPTVDMQEERARHDKRLFKEDDRSLDNADQQVIERSAEAMEARTDTKSGADEFDMFAENDGDEDDMFAPPTTKSRAQEAKSAQALDANMMDNWDDSDGYYITILGELLESRYHVTQNLGRGMFSSVVRATDTKTNQLVAIKIVRNNETMRKAGIKEVDILVDLRANDPEDKRHVIRFDRSFDHKGHLCMVFENLSMNLREVLKKFGRDVGINLKAIRAYAQQLFLGLGLLRKCQYLHADLKPDNILVSENRSVLKICDLGSATPITENATAPYLVSRFYRAPEVILGIPYDYGIDMWSVGCTLFELYTGKILFTGRNNNNMIRTIMECRGKFPNKLLRRGTLTFDYFDDLLNFRSMETDAVTGRVVTKLVDVKAKPVRDLRSRLMPSGKKLDEAERKELELFQDLLDKCLDLRPDKRITPNEALKHPFILRTKP